MRETIPSSLKIHCNACGHGVDVPAGSIAVSCPKCGARITLTAMETRPGAKDGSFDPTSLLGSEMGGYRLDSVLGGGGMGTVYEAQRTTGEGSEVAAVKILSPAFTHDEQFVERFRREADALTQLRHPNLIEVYARGEHVVQNQTFYFFVMERFFGEDLRSLMSRGKVAEQTAAAIVRQAAEGLSYAHAHGIVHRDVKPANILVQGDPAVDGQIKVVDFGVAQLASANMLTSLTSSSLVLGTINYMSPEQRVDASEIDHRADIYALGVVAYELLTGRLPIGAFEPPSELAGTQRAADKAVLSALRRDPAQRPSSVLAFAKSLESSVRKRSSLGWVVAAAAAVLLGTGAGVGGSMLAQEDDPPPMEIFQAKTPEPPSQKKDTPVEAVSPGDDGPPEGEEDGEAPAFAPSTALETLAKQMRRDVELAVAVSDAPPPKRKTEKVRRPRKKKKRRPLKKKARLQKNAFPQAAELK